MGDRSTALLLSLMALQLTLVKTQDQNHFLPCLKVHLQANYQASVKVTCHQVNGKHVILYYVHMFQIIGKKEEVESLCFKRPHFVSRLSSVAYYFSALLMALYLAPVDIKTFGLVFPSNPPNI